MVLIVSHSTGYTYSQICSPLLQSSFPRNELASKNFGKRVSFSSTARNRAQLFPLGFELLEFIVLAARKNQTVAFLA